MRSCMAGLISPPNFSGLFLKAKAGHCQPLLPCPFHHPSYSKSHCPTLDQPLIPGRAASFFYLVLFLCTSVFLSSSLCIACQRVFPGPCVHDPSSSRQLPCKMLSDINPVNRNPLPLQLRPPGRFPGLPVSTSALAVL